MINVFEKETTLRSLDGGSILDFYSIDAGAKYEQLGYLSFFFWGFLVLAWAALSFMRHSKR
jgi:hypothetical protein